MTRANLLSLKEIHATLIDLGLRAREAGDPTLGAILSMASGSAADAVGRAEAEVAEQKRRVVAQLKEMLRLTGTVPNY